VLLLSAPLERSLDQPADGFGAARRAILLLNPSIESGQFYRRHADLNGSIGKLQNGQITPPSDSDFPKKHLTPI
jgi:hypothetical protein